MGGTDPSLNQGARTGTGGTVPPLTVLEQRVRKEFLAQLGARQEKVGAAVNRLFVIDGRISSCGLELEAASKTGKSLAEVKQEAEALGLTLETDIGIVDKVQTELDMQLAELQSEREELLSDKHIYAAYEVAKEVRTFKEGCTLRARDLGERLAVTAYYEHDHSARAVENVVEYEGARDSLCRHVGEVCKSNGISSGDQITRAIYKAIGTFKESLSNLQEQLLWEADPERVDVQRYRNFADTRTVARQISDAFEKELESVRMGWFRGKARKALVTSFRDSLADKPEVIETLKNEGWNRLMAEVQRRTHEIGCSAVLRLVEAADRLETRHSELLGKSPEIAELVTTAFSERLSEHLKHLSGGKVDCDPRTLRAIRQDGLEAVKALADLDSRQLLGFARTGHIGNT